MVLELSILVGEVVARIFGRAVTTLEVVTSDEKSFTNVFSGDPAPILLGEELLNNVN